MRLLSSGFREFVKEPLPGLHGKRVLLGAVRKRSMPDEFLLRGAAGRWKHPRCACISQQFVTGTVFPLRSGCASSPERI